MCSPKDHSKNCSACMHIRMQCIQRSCSGEKLQLPGRFPWTSMQVAWEMLCVGAYGRPSSEWLCVGNGKDSCFSHGWEGRAEYKVAICRGSFGASGTGGYMVKPSEWFGYFRLDLSQGYGALQVLGFLAYGNLTRRFPMLRHLCFA